MYKSQRETRQASSLDTVDDFLLRFHDYIAESAQCAQLCQQATYAQQLKIKLY